MHPRLKILSEINKLQDQHCESCSYKNTSEYCRSECDISNQLKTLGSLLIENKAKDSRKSKSQSNIDIYFKDREVKIVEKKLTKEILFNLKGKGNSDTKIRKEYGLSNGKFYKLKNEFGMVGDNGGRPKKVFVSKAVAVKKELIVDDEVKELMSPTFTDIYLDSELEIPIMKDEPLIKDEPILSPMEVNISTVEDELLINKLKNENKSAVIDKLKLENKSLLNELATKQCECPDKISKLEAKVIRLESNLAIEKHNNHDLINHINTIQKYKSKYYKTVEALKAHLPN